MRSITPKYFFPKLVPSLLSIAALSTSWSIAFAAEEDELLDESRLDQILISASRLDVGLAGASTGIIDAETIANAPVQSLPELLAYQSGIQYRDLYNNNGGSGVSVDMRGFGATGTANSLIMVNGRRLNDIDLSFVDFGNIPLESIQHIEVIRGNAGAVLYGDGAVGGVINIITATGSSPEPSGTVELVAGSDAYFNGNVTYMQDINNLSVLAFASLTQGDGYRDNNEVDQHNFLVDLRYWGEGYETYATLSFHDQELGLPGARNVNPGSNKDEVADDPRGATTPDDIGFEDGFAASGGVLYEFSESTEGVFDIGYRRKEQNSEFYNAFGDSFTDTTLDTLSITPRVTFNADLGGMSWESINGLDVYIADYESERRDAKANGPIHTYTAEQTTIALYSQNTIKHNESLRSSFGLRLQQFDASIQDDYDPSAAVGFPWPNVETPDLDEDDVEYAAHLGVEYLITEDLQTFARLGRSFRLPTIDERIASDSAYASFGLEVQTSLDFEIGLQSKAETYNWQASVYWMDLEDELHYDPVNFINYNLDDTQRTGIELQGSMDIADKWKLFASASVTNAEFTSGDNDGNDVPLVAPFTATVSAQYQIQEWLLGMLVVNYVDEKRMDNDQANFQPQIPDHTLVDLKLKAEYQQWRGSIAIMNLLDEDYFNYAVASASTQGVYNAYPLAGTNFQASVAYRY